MKTSKSLCKSAFLVVFLMALVTIPAQALVSEVWVDDNFDPTTPGWGVTHFDKIQDGHDAVYPMGTVNVLKGIYYEHLVIHKQITLSGVDKDDAIIDGNGTDSVVMVLAGQAGTSISGFTIRNSGSMERSAGIFVSESDDVTIFENRIIDNYEGIYFSECSGGEVTKNDIMNSDYRGIGVYALNGDANGFAFNENKIHGSSDAAICIDIDTPFTAYNITIKYNSITGHSKQGIVVAHSSNSQIDNNFIYNNILEKKYASIYLSSSAESTISENYIHDNRGFGIWAEKCSNGTISDNTIIRNKEEEEAIIINKGSSFITISDNFVDSAIICFGQDSDHNVITRNTIKSSQVYNGIGVSNLSKDNTISYNLIDSALQDGIHVYSNNNIIHRNYIRNCGGEGMEVFNAEYNEITENVIINNTENGLWLRGATYNIIAKNIIAHNGGYGFSTKLGFANPNEFNESYHNSFVDNTLGNSYDEDNNSWDKGYPSGGNYWSDYTGDDLDGDGIGDTPYAIAGGVNFDNYPIIRPYGGGALWSDGFMMSAASGGEVNFTLHGGKTNANRYYLLLGSLSGTEPGFPLPGGMAVLPINWDSFTDLVWLFLNTPYFSDFLGQMDSSGEAAAKLMLPSLDPSMIGQTMHFAFTHGNPFDVASNPMPVQIVE